MVKSLFVDAESADEHQFMPQGMNLTSFFIVITALNQFSRIFMVLKIVS